MDCKVGDRVKVGSRIGIPLMWGTVIDIIPALADRVAMYRIRIDDKMTGPTLTPTPNECWIDEGQVYGPFHDQDSPYYHS